MATSHRCHSQVPSVTGSKPGTYRLRLWPPRRTDKWLGTAGYRGSIAVSCGIFVPIHFNRCRSMKKLPTLICSQVEAYLFISWMTTYYFWPSPSFARCRLSVSSVILMCSSEFLAGGVRLARHEKRLATNPTSASIENKSVSRWLSLTYPKFIILLEKKKTFTLYTM